MRGILFALLMALIGVTQAQTTRYIAFHYDDSGNRDERVIHMGTQLSPKNDTIPEEPPQIDEEYKDILSETEIKIYPNPTKGRLVVKIENLENGKPSGLTLFDMNGRQVSINESLQEINELDLSHEPSGTYVMRIIIEDEATSWKIIKQ